MHKRTQRDERRPLRHARSASAHIFATTSACAALLLAGCAQQASAFHPGEDSAVLTSRLGKPAETYSLPDGSKRLMWPTQPLGYTTIAADVSADGRIASVRQVLQTGEFSQAKIGTWTKNDVLVHFGRPAESSSAPRTHQDVWSYRYREDGVYHLLYNFYFDKSGVLRLTQQSPDPMRQTGDTLY